MKMKRAWSSKSLFITALCLVILIAGGCLVGPDFKPPPMTVPEEWAGVPKGPTDRTSMATTRQSDLVGWWREFNDPTLTFLVEQALKVNLDLKIAETRLRQARAARGVVAGGLWPVVTASGGYQWSKTGEESGQDRFQTGLDVAWEIDLFGGRRRSLESAGADVRAEVENIRAVQVSLIAEVALNYVLLRGSQQQILIAQKNLEAQRHSLGITRKRFEAGFASALDVANAEAAVASTESQIPVFEIAVHQFIHGLSVLLARPPADLLERLSPKDLLPRLPLQVPAGLPSDLLRRRPDIRASEARLHSATAKIGVAVADLFPVFSLTGAINLSSDLLHTLLSASKRSLELTQSITWPLFQGGAIRSNIRLQEALRDEAFITYQKTVLIALQEVEDSLTAFDREQRRWQDLVKAVTANRRAVDLSLKLYTAGVSDFLNVLVAQRSLYNSEDALAQSEKNIALDLIALYKALGGGWESPGEPRADLK
ncbi:MAG: efflux transporter outer membrane subunit [Deltaproteobacteria bacterium]|nr:efflux transporter outer membrane subunit [Deltaproteobacteria bacterium]